MSATPSRFASPAKAPNTTGHRDPTGESSTPVLLFLSDGRRYGVPLTRVREVVEIDRMQPIEGDGDTEDYIGVMVLRDEPIPLVAVRTKTQASDVDLPMCIVLKRGHVVIGLAAERIVGIRDFGPARPTKGLVATAEMQHAYLDENGEVVQAVDVDRWFNAQTALPLLADQRSIAEARDTLEEAAKLEKRYMALTVGDRLFAVDSTLVERAIDDIGTAPLPRRPGVRIDCVIEVSGNVLPVLRLVETDRERQTIFIIVNFAGQKWALATERVLGIVPDESPRAAMDDEHDARVISSKGAFHEVIDMHALIATKVPDFSRSGAQRALEQ
jgi:chemotaxis signal transduction protein